VVCGDDREGNGREMSPEEVDQSDALRVVAANYGSARAVWRT